ncbi:MAG: phosphatase PAP2 family protein [Siphonobacter sp.]
MIRLLLLLCLFIQINAFAQIDSVNRKPIWKALIAPATLMTAGLVTQGHISREIRTKVRKEFPDYKSRVDNYAQYAPTLAPLALGAVGIKGKHTFKDQLILTALSQLLSQSLTQGIKHFVAYPRPNGSENNSFPSGHTSMAFTGATLLSKEYGQRSIWYSIAGYGVASGVASFRVLKDRHWTADVLFSAGLSMASTEAVYRCYPWIQRNIFKRSNKVAMLPFYNGQAAGLAVITPL